MSLEVIVPFTEREVRTPARLRYNKALSKARIKIEHAFGRLKGRWRRLKNLHVLTVRQAVMVIVSGCILHNIAIMFNDLWEELDEDVEDEPPQMYVPQVYQVQKAAARKRDGIAGRLAFVV